MREGGDRPAEALMLSVVIPMKDEASGVEPLLERVARALDNLGLSAEIIAVDDGSRDDTLARIKSLRGRIPVLKAVSLSRNFGKEIAVLAGLEHAGGRAVVLMDADLGHPPEAIGEMLALWREGWHVVYGRRRELRRDPVRAILTGIFYRLFRLLAEVSIDPEGGDFMLLDRKVVDAFVSMRERHRFTRGLIAWAGYRTTFIPFVATEPEGRRSRWNLQRLLTLAINAITSFGSLPLRIWSYVGGAIAALSFLYAVVVVMRTLILGRDVPGFPTLAVAVTFLAGVQLIGLGILGDYIGRIFAESKGRPLYLVQEVIGFEGDRPVAIGETSRRREATRGL